MNDIDALREKYSEETGWVVGVSDVLVFLLYAFCTHIAFLERCVSPLNSLMKRRVNELFLGESSILLSVSLYEAVMAFIMARLSVYLYRKLNRGLFYFFYNSNDMDLYLSKIRARYSGGYEINMALRMIAVREIEKDKSKYLKQVNSMNSIGLLFFSASLACSLGVLSVDMVSVFLAFGCIFLTFICHWQAFSLYISQVIPRLVLEKMARGESITSKDAILPD